MAPRKGTRRACDPCSVSKCWMQVNYRDTTDIASLLGKVRCDGNQPCSRCEAASWDCTYLKTHGKSGPKGPRRTTEAAIRRLQERSKGTHDDGSRSNSETSFDAGSPRTTDLPYLDPIPLMSDSDVDPKAWPDILSPTLSAIPQEPHRISTACLSHLASRRCRSTHCTAFDSSRRFGSLRTSHCDMCCHSQPILYRCRARQSTRGPLSRSKRHVRIGSKESKERVRSLGECDYILLAK